LFAPPGFEVDQEAGKTRRSSASRQRAIGLLVLLALLFACLFFSYSADMQIFVPMYMTRTREAATPSPSVGTSMPPKYQTGQKQGGG
jgi:hypothetical protein